MYLVIRDGKILNELNTAQEVESLGSLPVDTEVIYVGASTMAKRTPTDMADVDYKTKRVRTEEDSNVDPRGWMSDAEKKESFAELAAMVTDATAHKMIPEYPHGGLITKAHWVQAWGELNALEDTDFSKVAWPDEVLMPDGGYYG